MKKMIFAVLTLMAVYVVSAQEPVTYKVQTVSTYNVSSVPEPIYANFKTSYPNAEAATWTTTSGWVHASFKNENNRMVHVYYNTQPWYMEPGRENSYRLALPVLNTYVPETVITSAINSYGATLYSITAIKTGENTSAYQIGLLENGTLKTIMMDSQSVAFTDTNK